MEWNEISGILQGGAPPAIAIVYFVWKLEARLARIEKAFEIVAKNIAVTIKDTSSP